MKASKYAQTQRIALTAQVPVERADEISEIAQQLGIPRHRLLVMALNIGIPLAAAQAQSKAAQQPTAVKE